MSRLPRNEVRRETIVDGRYQTVIDKLTPEDEARRDGKAAPQRQEWATDETVTPPYPLLRCPTCKAVFNDHEMHICAR